MNKKNFKDDSGGSAKPQIILKKVVKAFDNQAGRFNILKGINLRINQGEFVVISGKSGSGKTTLLNMMTGIDRPTEGEISVKGIEVHLLNEKKMASWRGRSIGIVFQFFQLMPTLTVLENVMLPMDFCAVIAASKRKPRAMDLLTQTGIADQAKKLPSALSGGEQQRVAIARALANDPAIIVADEPTGNLDSHTSEKVIKIFENLVSAGKTVIVVTHENNLSFKASRHVMISDGLVIEDPLSTGQMGGKES